MILGVGWYFGDFTKLLNPFGSNVYGYRLYRYEISLLVSGENELNNRYKNHPDAASLKESERLKIHTDFTGGYYNISSRKFRLMFTTAWKANDSMYP